MPASTLLTPSLLRTAQDPSKKKKKHTPGKMPRNVPLLVPNASTKHVPEAITSTFHFAHTCFRLVHTKGKKSSLPRISRSALCSLHCISFNRRLQCDSGECDKHLPLKVSLSKSLQQRSLITANRKKKCVTMLKSGGKLSGSSS